MAGTTGVIDQIGGITYPVFYTAHHKQNVLARDRNIVTAIVSLYELPNVGGSKECTP